MLIDTRFRLVGILKNGKELVVLASCKLLAHAKELRKAIQKDKMDLPKKDKERIDMDDVSSISIVLEQIIWQEVDQGLYFSRGKIGFDNRS